MTEIDYNNEIKEIEKYLYRLDSTSCVSDTEFNIRIDISDIFSSWIIKFRKFGVIVNNKDLIYSDLVVPDAYLSFPSVKLYNEVVSSPDKLLNTSSSNEICKSIKRTGSEEAIAFFQIKLMQLLHDSTETIQATTSVENSSIPSTIPMSKFLRLSYNGSEIIPLKHGWLMKKRDIFSGWRKRYFVIYNGRVEYYTNISDRYPRDVINVIGADVHIPKKCNVNGEPDHYYILVEPKAAGINSTLKLASEQTGHEGELEANNWEAQFQIAAHGHIIPYNNSNNKKKSYLSNLLSRKSNLNSAKISLCSSNLINSSNTKANFLPCNEIINSFNEQTKRKSFRELIREASDPFLMNDAPVTISSFLGIYLSIGLTIITMMKYYHSSYTYLIGISLILLLVVSIFILSSFKIVNMNSSNKLSHKADSNINNELEFNVAVDNESKVDNNADSNTINKVDTVVDTSNIGQNKFITADTKQTVFETVKKSFSNVETKLDTSFDHKIEKSFDTKIESSKMNVKKVVNIESSMDTKIDNYASSNRYPSPPTGDFNYAYKQTSDSPQPPTKSPITVRKRYSLSKILTPHLQMTSNVIQSNSVDDSVISDHTTDINHSGIAMKKKTRPLSGRNLISNLLHKTTKKSEISNSNSP